MNPKVINIISPALGGLGTLLGATAAWVALFVQHQQLPQVTEKLTAQINEQHTQIVQLQNQITVLKMTQFGGQGGGGGSQGGAGGGGGGGFGQAGGNGGSNYYGLQPAQKAHATAGGAFLRNIMPQRAALIAALKGHGFGPINIAYTDKPEPHHLAMQLVQIFNDAGIMGRLIKIPLSVRVRNSSIMYAPNASGSAVAQAIWHATDKSASRIAGGTTDVLEGAVKPFIPTDENCLILGDIYAGRRVGATISQ